MRMSYIVLRGRDDEEVVSGEKNRTRMGRMRRVCTDKKKRF